MTASPMATTGLWIRIQTLDVMIQCTARCSAATAPSLEDVPKVCGARCVIV